jgi:hypothetical protein
MAHRYELWSGGDLLAKYKTIGQALLGALWRSRKSNAIVYVWSVTPKFIAAVGAMKGVTLNPGTGAAGPV